MVNIIFSLIILGLGIITTLLMLTKIMLNYVNSPIIQEILMEEELNKKIFLSKHQYENSLNNNRLTQIKKLNAQNKR